MIDIKAKRGKIRLRLDGLEGKIIASLVGQLDDMLQTRAEAENPLWDPPTDPALARLLPDAMSADEIGARELRSLTETSLIRHKRSNLAMVSASIGGTVMLDAGTEAAWLRAITDLRLALAARLQIGEDGRPASGSSAGSKSALDIYEMLAWMQERMLAIIDNRDPSQPEPSR